VSALFNGQTSIFFSFWLVALFCSKNLAFAPKIMVLSEFGGLQPPCPLARTPMLLEQSTGINSR